jgi:predicted amino acid dehydrogenase
VGHYSIQYTKCKILASHSIRVALKTLDILEATDVLDNVRQQSALLKRGLSILQKQFPDVLSFSGCGLMYAVEFRDPEYKQVASIVSNVMWETALSYIICGFLLNEKNILCMPFLGKTGSIRFEPSLTVRGDQVMSFLCAVQDICNILRNQRHDVLLSYLIQRPLDRGTDITQRFVQKHLSNPPAPPVPAGETRRKFAFLCHVLSVEDTIKQLPPSVLAHFGQDEQRKLSEWILSAGSLEPEPVMTVEASMTSATGETVTGILICCSVSPTDMMVMSTAEKQALMDSYIQEAKAHGVNHIVGLGAFTSVITKSGTKYLDTADAHDEYLYTTGSSFTALASAESLKEHAGSSQMGSLGVTIIGARGQCGHLILLELLQHFGTVNVVGSPKTGVEAMKVLVGDSIRELIDAGYNRSNVKADSAFGKILALLDESELPTSGGLALMESLDDLANRYSREIPLTISTDASSVADRTNYVISATNEGKAFLSSDTFHPGTVVFDLARPFDFTAAPDSNIQVFEGGLVNMPETVMWGDTNVAHHPAGINLACKYSSGSGTLL